MIRGIFPDSRSGTRCERTFEALSDLPKKRQMQFRIVFCIYRPFEAH